MAAEIEVIRIMQNIDAGHADWWKTTSRRLYHLPFGDPHKKNPTVVENVQPP